MNTRQYWTNNRTTFDRYKTVSETISNVRSNFDIRRYHSAEGYSVSINDTDQQVIIQSHTNPLNENREDRILLFPYDVSADKGHYVTIENSDRPGMDGVWLAMSMVESVDGAYNSIQIQKTNNVLKFYTDDGKLNEYRCVIKHSINETSPLGYKIIGLPEGTIELSVQMNEYTSQICVNKRFLFGYRDNCVAYKVTAVNNIIDENFMTMILDVDQINTDTDDLVNNIADANRYNYELIIDSDDFEQSIGYSSQLDYSLKLNGSEISGDVVWSSSDDSIGTIDASGNFNLLALGSVTFTCALESNSTVYDTVTIDVVAIPNIVKEVRFSPNTTEIYSYSGGAVTYEVFKYNNDVVQADTFTFTLSGASSDSYDYTYIDGNHFTIASNGYDSIPLTVLATSLVDGTTGTIEINLKPLF